MGDALILVNMAKVTVSGPHLSAMTGKIFVDDLDMWILRLQWEIAGNYTLSELNYKLSHY